MLKSKPTSVISSNAQRAPHLGASTRPPKLSEPSSQAQQYPSTQLAELTRETHLGVQVEEATYSASDCHNRQPPKQRKKFSELVWPSTQYNLKLRKVRLRTSNNLELGNVSMETTTFQRPRASRFAQEGPLQPQGNATIVDAQAIDGLIARR